VQIVLQFNRACRPKKAAVQAIKDFEIIDRSKLEKSNVVDIMQANVLNSIGRAQEAEKLMIAAIIKNPLVVGPYADLGQMLATQYRTAEAWEAYSIARKLQAQHPMLESVKAIESKMERDFPDFF